MDLFVALFVAFAIGPLGVFLIIIAALGLRDVRPQRSKAVLWLSTLMAVCFVVVFYIDPLVGNKLATFAASIEWVFMAGVVVFCGLSVALMVPPYPGKPRANWFGYLGLCCFAAAAFSLYLISQVNFSL